MEIYWSTFAKEQLQSIYSYYFKRASAPVASRLVDGIIRHPYCLIKQPKLGKIEPLLTNRKEIFRFLVYKKYKIIYTVQEKENRVFIVDVFDTRLNPIKILRKR